MVKLSEGFMPVVCALPCARAGGVAGSRCREARYGYGSAACRNITIGLYWSLSGVKTLLVC